MKYTKISPFDFYLLLEKRLPADITGKDRLKLDRYLDVRTVGEVKISISGSGVPEPYSFTQTLREVDGKVYLCDSTVLPSDGAQEYFKEDWARLLAKPKAGEFIVTYDPESDPEEVPKFVQKLGMNEYPYDRVIRCPYPVSAIYQLCEAQELFGDAVKVAQGGAKILWECLPESEIRWRDRFVEARCATWLTGRGGVEVGPRDPSI
jgi:hypothetical protein